MGAGMAVFDTMRYIKSDVSTVCVGLAASMGAFILASGQKVALLSCPIDITMYVNSPGGSVTAGWSLPHHHLSIDIVPRITCHTSQLIIAHASTTQHPAKLPYSRGAYRVAALDGHAA